MKLRRAKIQVKVSLTPNSAGQISYHFKNAIFMIGEMVQNVGSSGMGKKGPQKRKGRGVRSPTFRMENTHAGWKRR